MRPRARQSSAVDTGGYALLGADGRPVCEYEGIIEGDAASTSQVLTEPVEGGQLAAYNKVDAPQSVKLTLALGYDPAAQSAALGKLQELRRRVGDGALCTYVTPSAVYERMALEVVGESRSAQDGATLLTVVLQLTQVRAVQVQTQAVASWSPKRATSAEPVNQGRVQPKRRSFSEKIRTGVAR